MYRAYERLEGAFEKVAALVRSLRSDRERLASALLESQEEANARAGELSSARKSVQDQEARIAEFANVAEKLTDSERVRAELDESLEAVRTERQSLLEKVDRARRDADIQSSSLQAKIDDLREQRDQARETTESMLLRIRQLESEELAGRKDRDDQRTALNVDLEAAIDMAAAREAEVAELTDQIAVLRRESEEAPAGVDSSVIQDAIAGIEEACALLEARIVSAE